MKLSSEVQYFWQILGPIDPIAWHDVGSTCVPSLGWDGLLVYPERGWTVSEESSIAVLDPLSISAFASPTKRTCSCPLPWSKAVMRKAVEDRDQKSLRSPDCSFPPTIPGAWSRLFGEVLNGHCGNAPCSSPLWLGPASSGRRGVVDAPATWLPIKFFDTTSTSPLMSIPKWSSRALISSNCSTCVLPVSNR